MSWKISQLEIVGVKGILEQSGDFALKDGKSIAIFAPNACGKSGYADAIEYLFSQDGSVEHLGKGGIDSEHGGKHALHHVLAKASNITPEISVDLKNSELKREISVTRPVKTGRSDTIPSELTEVISNSPAHRILRQHDLRRFVVDMEPREKYAEISRWLGLDHLEHVLTHLTTTQNDLMNANPDRETAERVRDLTENTNGVITEYDKKAVFQWCSNEIQKHLKEKISINSIDDIDTYIVKLEDHRTQLITHANVPVEVIESIKGLEWAQTSILDDKKGLVSLCFQTLTQVNISKEEVIRVRELTREAVFQDVWVSSKQLLDTEATDKCPVCLTPWSETQVGSQENACIHLTSSLSQLTEYREVQNTFEGLRDQFIKNLTQLMNILRKVRGEADTLSMNGIVKEISQLETIFEGLSSEEDIFSKTDEFNLNFKKCQTLFFIQLPEELKKIDIEEIPDEAKKIQIVTDYLKKLKAALVRLNELDEEARAYEQITYDFNIIADIIQNQTGELVNTIIQALKVDVVQIFKKIQATDAIPDIIIEPDSVSKTLLLRVNFHSDDRTLPPAGYLSESQINTLGLAIFISAIKMFNRDFPFVVLDDIVSSYDADHRARIVDVIAEDLTDFQVFLTTHDERFYNALKMRLQDKEWQFDKISGWALDTGPKRQSDVTKSEQIRELIMAGDARIAGNALRQYIEEWLDKKCADYWVSTLHKRPLKEYERTIFDYWDPFISRLKSIKGEFFKNCIEAKEHYQHVKSHPLLNYYSHWQANPYEWGAIGDVDYIFKEFQEFETLFNCHSCSKPLKYDHDANKVYCLCGGQIFP